MRTDSTCSRWLADTVLLRADDDSDRCVSPRSDF